MDPIIVETIVHAHLDDLRAADDAQIRPITPAASPGTSWRYRLLFSLAWAARMPVRLIPRRLGAA